MIKPNTGQAKKNKKLKKAVTKTIYNNLYNKSYHILENRINKKGECCS